MNSRQKKNQVRMITNLHMVRQKRSELWNFFTIIDAGYAECDICHRKICYRTTNSNLKRHLERKHPNAVFKEEIVKIADETTVESPDNCPDEYLPSSNQQPSEASFSSASSNNDNIIEISATQTCQGDQTAVNMPIIKSIKSLRQCSTAKIPPPKMTHTSVQEIDKQLMKLFTLDMHPFSLVESTGFRSFVKALNPSYELPIKKTISKTMLAALYENCENAAKEAIKDVTSVCLTTDCWTSASSESFMAVTAHFVADNFEIQSVLLDCCRVSANHTSVLLANEITRIIKEWNLENKVMLVVSDNTADLKKAVMEELKLDFYECLAHQINLIIRESLVTVDDLLSNIREIVIYFRSNDVARGKFNTYQINSGLDPEKLLQDVPTRWTSTYFMLQRFCDLERFVKSTIAVLDKKLPHISPADWKVAREICTVLKPFLLVTESLYCEKYATASLVIVLSNGLFDICSKLKQRDLPEKVKKVVVALEKGVKDSLGNVEQNNTLEIAMFLDPRFKACFQNAQLAERVETKVVNAVADKLITEQLQKSDEIEVITPEPKRPKLEDDELSPWAYVDKHLANSTIVKPTSKASVEVRHYLEEPSLAREKDPMDWWKQNAYNFPNLSKLVKEYCCCLATSVPCERLFTKAGCILNERRNHLNSSKVKEVVFINTNVKHINLCTSQALSSNT